MFVWVKKKFKHTNTTFSENYNLTPLDMYNELSNESKGAKIRNRYNQVPHLTLDTNGNVTDSQWTPQTRAKRSAYPTYKSNPMFIVSNQKVESISIQRVKIYTVHTA